MDIFKITDLTSEFSAMDMVLVMVLSFALSAFIGWIYKLTHRGTSYTQSFVFTLVLNGMVVALVMMIVGSNIARAFSLVGALSIIRFRNAVKETRDVGFIFFTMVVIFLLLALVLGQMMEQALRRALTLDEHLEVATDLLLRVGRVPQLPELLEGEGHGPVLLSGGDAECHPAEFLGRSETVYARDTFYNNDVSAR